jgi:hypothetical protein
MSKRRKKGRIQEKNVEKKISEVILMEGLGCWLTNTK